MKQLIIFLGLLLNGTLLFAQNANSYVYTGNQLYNEKQYKAAEAEYRKSLDKKSQTQGKFNLGDALYKQKKFGDAAQDFTDIGTTADNTGIKAKAFHNLGNAMLSDKKYDESIAAYKKSLLNNPNDDETRYNLAYAQEMLKKQNQNKKNNQNQNKNNQDKNQQNKQNQDNKNNKDKGDPNKQNKDQDKQNQQQQQQPNSVSKDDAQRMLDALNNQEQATQDKLKNKKLKGGKLHISKDW
jgi:Ca-activated chloride channel family protein